MIKRERKKQPDGTYKTFIRVVESYRPGPGLLPKQRAIKPFGYLEDQEDQEAFMKEVMDFNDNYKRDRGVSIEIAKNEAMYSGRNRKLNYGHKYLDAIYGMLGIDNFIKKQEKKSGFRGDYSLADIFRFLVLLRILSPCSKRSSAQLKNGFYGMSHEFALQDVYRALDRYCGFEADLQRHLNAQVKKTIGRNLSYAFFDVTNYFFQIDFPGGDDDLRAKGVSKEHRLNPIVAMGLFMDENGLPVSMSIFPGNTSDTKTLLPVMEDVKDSYGLGRIVVVADKGLNSSTNINAAANNGDGFIFSQQLRGTKGKRYEEKLFDKNGWTENPDGSYRWKLFEECYFGIDSDGKKKQRKRNVLLYWNKSDAEMMKKKRDEKLRKAEKAILNNAYAIKHSYEEYTKEEPVNPDTGEIMEGAKKFRSVDKEKAETDARYDGYFCIITSELEMNEQQIRKAYHGLWRIEESFRIMKSDLYARPVFVSKNEHIRSHFLICFVALLIVRILQHMMGQNALSAKRISKALNAATCRVLKGGFVHLDDVGGKIAFKKSVDKHGKSVDTLAYSKEDEIALDYKRLQETFGTDFYGIYPKQEDFNGFLKSIAVTLQNRID